MKRWQKVALALVLAVTVWVAVCFWIVGTADCVVRVSFTGFSAIGHVPFEYYAVRGQDAVRIPQWIVVFSTPEAVSGSKYEDEVTTQWFTQLIYMPRTEMYEGEKFLYKNYPWLQTDFGEQYRVYYQNWGGPKIDAGTDVQAVMRQTAHEFHDGDPDNWCSMDNASGERGLTWFIVVSDGKQTLVQHQEDALYLPLEDGAFRLVMECPEDGQFDYYWFP